MRRIAFAGVALLVVAIGAAVMIPGRGHKADARSILIAAAQAMEEAETVHLAGRGAAATEDTPSGLRMTPQRFDGWLSSRKAHLRVEEPDRKLGVIVVLDADALRWWLYDADKEKKTLYVADLTPIASRVGEALSSVTEMLYALAAPARIREEVAVAYPDARESATTQTRDGRKLVVITITATIKRSPRRVTSRWVFEVDAESKHLLTVRQYAQAEGSPEELVTDVDTIEYDVPFPAGPEEMGLPKGTKTVRASARIEESKSLLTLVMTAGGKQVGQLGIQPSKTQLDRQRGR